MPNDYITKNDFNNAMERVDKRFDSMTQMIAELAEEATSMNVFLKEHIKSQGALHSRIDHRLDTLEAV